MPLSRAAAAFLHDYCNIIQKLYCNKKTSIDVKIKELNYNIALETLSRSYVLTMPPFPQFVTNTSTQKCQNISQLCALFSSLRQKEKQTYLYVFCFKIFPSNLIYFARLFIMSRLLYRLWNWYWWKSFAKGYLWRSKVLVDSLANSQTF